MGRLHRPAGRGDVRLASPRRMGQLRVRALGRPALGVRRGRRRRDRSCGRRHGQDAGYRRPSRRERRPRASVDDPVPGGRGRADIQRRRSLGKRRSEMKFGITLRPDERLPAARAVEVAKRAEANGFSYGWMFDSHVLWQDPYPLLTLMGEATTDVRLGTCVTNPATRDITVTASALATLNEITDGRMDLGIGRGDSARRVMGKKPTTVAYMEECCRIVRALTAGEKISLDG